MVELQQPLRTRGGEVAEVEIRRPNADAMIRWARWDIPSSLALLAELCGLPEKVIRQLPLDDFERVMFAFRQVVGPAILQDIEDGKRPLASEEEELPEGEQGVPPPDPIDPRFPAVDGPVRRLQPKPVAPAPTAEADMAAADIDLSAPQTIAAVR
jgi:hypothetical protein